ncbi:hypothetical protein ACET3Z_024634 [Daucus carota]
MLSVIRRTGAGPEREFGSPVRRFLNVHQVAHVDTSQKEFEFSQRSKWFQAAHVSFFSGPEASVVDLIDFITDAQMAKADDISPRSCLMEARFLKFMAGATTWLRLAALT